MLRSGGGPEYHGQRTHARPAACRATPLPSAGCAAWASLAPRRAARRVSAGPARCSWPAPRRGEPDRVDDRQHVLRPGGRPRRPRGGDFQGLGTMPELHRVQHEMEMCGECGYSTPGSVCSMAAECYRPHREHEFDLHAIGGNLCRCTGYHPILDATQVLPALAQGECCRRFDRGTRMDPECPVLARVDRRILGDHDEGQERRGRAAAETEVRRPDPQPVAAHRRWTSTTSARRCRR